MKKIILIIFISINFISISFAKIVEEVKKVPVTVTDANGVSDSREIVVTVWREDSRVKSPYLFFNHGRQSHPAMRKQFDRVRYAAQSKYWVQQGFVVIIPTRVGYGESGVDFDPEDSGSCRTISDFPGQVMPQVQQTKQVLEFALKQLTYVDTTQGILVGQSYGGLGAIKIASIADEIKGLKGVVNFAGGGFGRPSQLGQFGAGTSCHSSGLEKIFAEWSKNKVPTLWFYSPNDKFFGPSDPKDWHASFKNAGGTGEFINMPEWRNDGHGTIGDIPNWKPHFDKFLKITGVPFKEIVPPEPIKTKPTGFARLDDISKVPSLGSNVNNQERRDGLEDSYKKFLLFPDVTNRAFLLHTSGAYWRWWGGVDAVQEVIDKCLAKYDTGCKLYAVNSDVVW